MSCPGRRPTSRTRRLRRKKSYRRYLKPSTSRPLPPSEAEAEAEAEELQPATEIPRRIRRLDRNRPRITFFAYIATGGGCPPEPSSDSSLSGMTLSENPSDTPSGIPSPMPWNKWPTHRYRLLSPKSLPRRKRISRTRAVFLPPITSGFTMRQGEVVAPAPATEEVLPITLTESAQSGVPTPSKTARRHPLRCPHLCPGNRYPIRRFRYRSRRLHLRLKNSNQMCRPRCPTS